VRVETVGPRLGLYTKGGRRRIVPPLVFGLGVLAYLLRHGRRYDVVHTCSFPYFSLLAAAAARPLARFGLIVDWFEVWSSSYWHDYLGGIGGRIGRLVQRLGALAPQHAYCFSELHAGRLREEGLRGEVTVLRGLYGESLHAPTPRPADPLVLFAGRLIPEKQAPLGVAAIALATQRVDGLRGEFLGDGPERQALERAIRDSGMTGVVEARGFTDGQTLDREMRRSLCVLLPSRREGYGMVIVEAAARATPSVVVAGKDNAAAELVIDGVNGFVAPSSEPEAIAQAIERVDRAGLSLRESTARWFTENAETLSLESSLRRVLAGYATWGPSTEPSARPRARS
jgi:glycosyltransferase involved in cell wall biosynthesis